MTKIKRDWSAGLILEPINGVTRNVDGALLKRDQTNTPEHVPNEYLDMAFGVRFAPHNNPALDADDVWAHEYRVSDAIGQALGVTSAKAEYVAGYSK